MKIRIWDIISKEMVEDIDKLFKNPSILPTTIFSGGDSQFITMLSTEKYDKCNNEIYEGDIIELVNDIGLNIRVVCRFGSVHREVMGSRLKLCDIVGFYYETKEGRHKFPIVENYEGKEDYEIFKVIGNIYENPELLLQQDEQSKNPPTKYRLYDAIQENFIYPNELGFFVGRDGELILVNGFGEIIPVNTLIKIDGYFLQEFLYIYDKEGTPIYDYDVLDFDTKEWNGKFEPEVFVKEKVVGDFQYCGTLSDVSIWRKIIGNNINTFKKMKIYE